VKENKADISIKSDVLITFNNKKVVRATEFLFIFLYLLST